MSKRDVRFPISPLNVSLVLLHTFPIDPSLHMNYALFYFLRNSYEMIVALDFPSPEIGGNRISIF